MVRMNILLLAGLLSYAGVTIYIANQVEAARLLIADPGRVEGQTRLLRLLLYGVLGLIVLFGMAVFQTARLSDLPPEMLLEVSPEELPEINMAAALVTFVLALLAAFAGFRLVNNPDLRLRLQEWFRRAGGAYQAQSVVHTTALILTFMLIVGTVGQFVLQGGISGVAETLRETSLNVSDTLFSGLLEVVLTLLGVGFAIRRGIPETLLRLGLRLPTLADIGLGLGIAVLTLIVVSLLLSVWQVLVPAEEFAAQTEAIEALDAAVISLPLAFVVAISAALGEEIWLRGGVQPVFGLVASSALFALLHIQALLSLGMFIFFAIGLAFGWLRQRYSTTAAVIAHFSFNFLPFLLAAMVQ